jgi:hypothetical protein
LLPALNLDKLPASFFDKKLSKIQKAYLSNKQGEGKATSRKRNEML